jgi:hypothetical protein
MARRMDEGRVFVRGESVRLRMPAAVANDLDALKQTIVDLGERLGCRDCFSGADCLFEREKHFVVDEGRKLEPNPLPWRALPQDPTPIRPVQVSLAARVGGDMASVHKAVERVLERLGCGECCSGFDIAFRHELDLITVDEGLNVQGFGRFA